MHGFELYYLWYHHFQFSESCLYEMIIPLTVAGLRPERAADFALSCCWQQGAALVRVGFVDGIED